MAPELWANNDQTPKVDMYALGAIIIGCLQKFPSRAGRLATWQHRHLQNLATKLGVAPMLANVAEKRPTACELLNFFRSA